MSVIKSILHFFFDINWNEPRSTLLEARDMSDLEQTLREKLQFGSIPDKNDVSSSAEMLTFVVSRADQV